MRCVSKLLIIKTEKLIFVDKICIFYDFLQVIYFSLKALQLLFPIKVQPLHSHYTARFMNISNLWLKNDLIAFLREPSSHDVVSSSYFPDLQLILQLNAFMALLC